ncbi:MAG TPA: type II toxin-antitoxin system RelE/ParE family toxin [Gemmataceae bacterium]|jgi:plasmid stabilization system protein ParE|nr:type II toxin-antitoxin system RelE/ParE family toxin [Gemmataceae bacterium]
MISPELDFHSAAIREARQAYRWYLRRSALAADRFRKALEAALAQIIESPDRWPAYLHGTRYRLLRRFPFFVIYRIRADRLQVIAVAHYRKKPGYWKARK